MVKRLVSIVVAAVLAVSLAGTTEALKLWSVTDGAGQRKSSSQLRNARLENVEKFFFEFQSRNRFAASEIVDGASVEFDIPDSLTGVIVTKKCVLRSGNPLVPAALVEKYPTLLHFRARCPDAEQLTMTVDTSRADGMSALFLRNNGAFAYIDSASKGTSEYMVYDVKDALRQGTAPVIEMDGVLVTPAEDMVFVDAEVAAERKKLVGSSLGYKFKTAILTNNEYSVYHGNTKLSIFAALTTMMTRLNGVMMHEFGIYYEFVDNEDDAICIAGTDDTLCDELLNTRDILFQNTDFLTAKGIAYSSYDLGHSVTTGSGGLASLASMCSATSKAQGTSGQNIPENDPFTVDYVAHEVGHQLFGYHSFRDCRGPDDGNLSPQGAVEPGSASSIMGYAGVCGGTNNDIQQNSDPYFSNRNLQEMYDFILSVQEDGTCGESFDLNNILPDIIVPDICEVPIGNYFQLDGTTSSAEGTTFFSWDRVDPGYEDFESTTIGKFRSWKPTRASSRFFPNLHFINFPQDQPDIPIELLPVAEKIMDFRFAERRLYDTEIRTPEFDLGVIGDFVYADTEVRFLYLEPLVLTSPASGSSVQAGSSFTFEWAAGQTTVLSDTVEFYIAENTFVSTDDFDYEVNNKELDWVKIGEADTSDGSATFTVPVLVATGDLPVNVMVRAGSDACFLFDLATDVALLDPQGATSTPTIGETSSPTLFPTQFPTTTAIDPTVSPTPAVTVPPVATTPPVGSGDEEFDAVAIVAFFAAVLVTFLVVFFGSLCLMRFMSTRGKSSQEASGSSGPIIAGTQATGTRNAMYGDV